MACLLQHHIDFVMHYSRRDYYYYALVVSVVRVRNIKIKAAHSLWFLMI